MRACYIKKYIYNPKNKNNITNIVQTILKVNVTFSFDFITYNVCTSNDLKLSITKYNVKENKNKANIEKKYIFLNNKLSVQSKIELEPINHKKYKGKQYGN